MPKRVRRSLNCSCFPVLGLRKVNVFSRGIVDPGWWRLNSPGSTATSIERPIEIVEKELPRPGPPVGDPAVGEAAQPLGVVHLAQLSHKRRVTAFEQLFEQKPGAGFVHHPTLKGPRRTLG